MNEQHADANPWERVERFSFDEGQPALTFARRLARENGWSLAHAERVLRKYRRFAYLAVVAGHAVTPSPAVDQAWHLHLTYTRSYWHRFCQETLGIPLHHEPTRGGAEEAHKHALQYAATLESYAQHFGESPPGDLWPAMNFSAGAERWVDTRRVWIIPKPHAPWRSASVATAITAIPLATAWNPLNFDGPTFLFFYVILGGLAVMLALALRLLASDGSDPENATTPHDPYEVAYLANGTRGVIQSAFTQLILNGHLRLEHGTLARGEPLTTNAPAIEKSLYSAATDDGGFASDQLKSALKSTREPIAEIKSSLREKGFLAPHPEESIFRRGLPAALLFLVTILGFLKLFVGVARDKPVGFLVALLLLFLFLSILFFVAKGRLTRAGKAALASLEAEHELLKSGSVDLMSPRDAALLVGLFGSSYLVGTHLTMLHDIRGQMGDSSSSFLGSGCGGGGDGCGGGGGGCGGCGGD